MKCNLFTAFDVADVLKGGLLAACMGLAATSTFAAVGDDCLSDARQYCALSQGDGQTYNCLLDHQNDVTDACYAHLKKHMESVAPAAQTPSSAALPPAGAAATPAALCPDCGQVISITKTDNNNAKTAGMLGGALIGAFIGNQVGRGSGNAVATVAGAAGGAYAGNKIAGSAKVWKIKVHFSNGDDKTFSFDHDPNLREGDVVKMSGKSIVRN